MLQNNNILNANSITKYYNSKQVLNDLSISLNERDIITIVGPSGCGKSTFLRLIGKKEDPCQGQIEYSKKIDSVFYAPQAPALLPWLTVKENLLLPFKFDKTIEKNRTEKETIVMEALKKVGLNESTSLYPNELSGGMKERVVFAQMLIQDSVLILMDEPLSSIDEITKFEILVLARKLWNDKNKTIVWITHDITEAIFISDKIYLLSNCPSSIINCIEIEKPRPTLDTFISEPYYNEMKSVILHEYQKIAIN